MLEVWLNVKLVSRTKFDKTIRNIALLCAELKMMDSYNKTNRMH